MLYFGQLRNKSDFQQDESFTNLKQASDYQEMINLRKENSMMNKTINELRFNNIFLFIMLYNIKYINPILTCTFFFSHY